MTARKLTRREKALAGPPQKVVAPVLKKDSYTVWFPLIIFLSGFILYANTLNHQYALDDYSIILENKSTKKGFDALGEVFSTSFRHGYIFVSDELYRPVTKAVLAIQWGISPNNPFPGHFLNVILFALTGIVLFKILVKWLNADVIGAFFITMLFIAHPVHTEAVANIKSLDEILGFLGGIMALHQVYLYSVSGNLKYLIFSAAWFAFALFSKESSITFLAVMPAVSWFFTSKGFKQGLKATGINLIVAVIFLLIRSSVLQTGGITLAPSVVDNMLMAAPDALTKFTTAVFILGLYLRTLLIPYPLSFDNSWPQLPLAGPGDWKFLLAALILISLFAYALIRLKKKDLMSFAILFFFITVSVSSNLFVTIGTHWGERLMYTPSFAVCFALGLLLRRISGKYTVEAPVTSRQAWSLPFAALFIVWAGLTVTRNPVWENNGTLYTSGLVSAPNSTRVQYYMGNHLVKEEQYAGKSQNEADSILKTGISYLKRSVELSPTFTDAWNQMGVAYYRLKDYDNAINAYNSGLKVTETDPTLYNNLGTALFSIAKYEEARQMFAKATDLKPDYAEAWTNLGSTYGTVQQFDKALEYFNRAIQADPMYADAYHFMGMTWKYKGDEMKANTYLSKAAEIRRQKSN